MTRILALVQTAGEQTTARPATRPQLIATASGLRRLLAAVARHADRFGTGRTGT